MEKDIEGTNKEVIESTLKGGDALATSEITPTQRTTHFSGSIVSYLSHRFVHFVMATSGKKQVQRQQTN